MARFFHSIFGQQVVTNTYTTKHSSSRGRKTCSMRYAKALREILASSLDYSWSWSSSHRNTSAHAGVLYLAVGTREYTTCTLHAGRVVFLPRSVIVHQYLSTVIVHQHLVHLDSPRHRLPLSTMRQVVVELGECRNRYCEDTGKALVVDIITIRFHQLVVMPEACARGYGT